MTRRRLPIPLTTFSLAEAPPQTASLCHGCDRLEGRNSDGTARCEAFERIPAAIWTGRADHRAGIDGDRGLTFRPLGEYGRQMERAFVAAVTVRTAASTSGATEVLDTPPASRPDTAPNKVGESLPDAPPEQWHAVIGVEGVPSGDRRQVETSALTWRDLTPTPLPFLDAHTQDDGNQVAQMTRVERAGNRIEAWGHYLETPAAAEFRQLLESAGRLGASWELDDVDVEIDWPEGEGDLFAEPELVRITRARLIAAAYTPVPAFSECYIEPIEQSDLRLSDAGLIASAVPAAPPRSWFDDPKLDGPTPLTITDEGRVYGHLAVWGTCHVGFQGTCITPPYEASMDYFGNKGHVITDDGERLQIGLLTFHTGHADAELDHQATVSHYDHTGTQAARLLAGPDDHGIWLAGALCPGLTAEQVAEVQAAAVSGDWRRIDGALRLVAALCVNVPGFPMPRVHARVASGVQTTLIAAGMIRPGFDRGRYDKVAELLAERIGRDRRSLAASLASRVHPTLTTAAREPCVPCGQHRKPRLGQSASAAPRSGKVAYEIVHPDGERTRETTLIGAIRESRRVGGRYKVVNA